MNPYDVEALLGKIIRLLICTGYNPNYTNRVTMLVGLLHVMNTGHNPTIFKRATVEAAIGRFTN